MKEVACTLAFLMMTQFVHGLSILQCKINPSFLNPPENWNSSCPLFWLVIWPRFYRLETLWRFCFGFSIRTLPRLSWFCWIVESPGWRDLEVDYPQRGNPGNVRTSLMPWFCLAVVAWKASVHCAFTAFRLLSVRIPGCLAMCELVVAFPLKYWPEKCPCFLKGYIGYKKKLPLSHFSSLNVLKCCLAHDLAPSSYTLL